MADGCPVTGGLSRRRFLAGAAAGTAALAAGCSATGSDGSEQGAESASGNNSAAPAYLEFEGVHQTGIAHPGNANGILAAFTVTADDRVELQSMFESLSSEIRHLMSGTPYEDREPAFPPLHTGAVGNPAPPSDLAVVVSVGASLFVERFGLADRKPLELERMPFLANDRLDPERSHGDLLLTITSAHEDISLFALRQLMRANRGSLALHWMLEGYNRRTSADQGEAGQRNLMGFIDGTANLDLTDNELMDRHVWVADDDGEPAWAVAGSYHVVRVIRMFVEFWDRTRLSEQEAIIGRRKDNGAPLDGDVEIDVPDYDNDPRGVTTPLDAHIRLANPRTEDTERDLLLRKGLSFSRGFDGSGQLDQGLAFVSFQRRLEQFLNVQRRLAGEPLEEYILPQGGGFFFALPGVVGADDYLGGGLVA